MIDLFSLWQDFQSEVNTSENGWFTVHDFVRYTNSTSIKLWNKWTAKAEKSQEEKDKLFPFLKSKNLPVNTTSTYYGIAAKPKDYGRLASARIVVHKEKETIPCQAIDNGVCDGFKTKEEITDEYYDNIREYPVTLIDDQRWGPFCQHLTKGPTLQRPGMTQVNDQFKVAPRKVSVIAIDYYIEPTPATYDFTLATGNPQTGSGDQIIYNAATSIPLQWPAQMTKEFLDELKSGFIQYTRDQNFSSISAQQKQINP